MILAIVHLNQRIGFEAAASAWIHDLVLASASQAAVFWWQGWNDQARTSLLHLWIDQSLAVEPGCRHLHEFVTKLIDEQFSVRRESCNLQPSLLCGWPKPAVTDSRDIREAVLQ
jgi:hypothetical protein